MTVSRKYAVIYNTVCAALCSIVIAYCPTVASQEHDTAQAVPNAISLLKAVLNNRLSTPPSSVKIKHVHFLYYGELHADSITQNSFTNVWSVDFDGELRRVVFNNDESVQGIFNGGSVRKGAFNGDYAIEYFQDWGRLNSSFVRLGHIKSVNRDLFFADLRLLGMSSSLDRVSSFPIKYIGSLNTNDFSAENKGLVMLDNRPAWHVNLRRKSDNYTENYWISKEGEYRFLKMTRDIDDMRTTERWDICHSHTVFEYDYSEYPWLFSKVVHSTPWSEDTIFVLNAEKVPGGFPEEHWNIENMGLPVGIKISDERSGNSFGRYWDGETVSKEFVFPGETTSNKQKTTSKKQTYFIAAAVSIVVLPIVFFTTRLVLKKAKAL